MDPKCYEEIVGEISMEEKRSAIYPYDGQLDSKEKANDSNFERQGLYKNKSEMQCLASKQCAPARKGEDFF